MISFVNDYSENAYPEILDALVKTNYKRSPVYSIQFTYCNSFKTPKTRKLNLTMQIYRYLWEEFKPT